MPIYAYKCESCGHQQDVLQKLSDPVLSTCPSCGQSTFAKQITAAGFQLKGSGWYQTDFRNGSGGKPGEKVGEKGAEAKPGAKPGAKPDTSSQSSSDTGASTAAPAASAAASPVAAGGAAPSSSQGS